MQTKKTIVQLGFSVILLAGILAGCSQESENVTPQPPAEKTEEVQILSDPIPIDPPESEVEEDISNLPFPGESISRARAEWGGTSGIVSFNDPAALDIIPEDAINTFATWPFYIQQVGNAWMHVREKNYGPKVLSSNYGHYHLNYENFDPIIDLETGQLCEPVGGGCVEINPLQEQRYLATHAKDQWIEIRAYDYDNPYRVFDLEGIYVYSGSIKLMFRKESGQWYNYPSLAPGYYEFSYFCQDITKVLITSVSGGSVAFDNVKVHVPAY